MAQKPQNKIEPAAVELKNSAEPLVLPEPVIKPQGVAVAAPKPTANGHVSPVVTARELYKSLSDSSAQGRAVRLKELARQNKDVKWLLEEFNKIKK